MRIRLECELGERKRTGRHKGRAGEENGREGKSTRRGELNGEAKGEGKKSSRSKVEEQRGKEEREVEGGREKKNQEWRRAAGSGQAFFFYKYNTYACIR